MPEVTIYGADWCGDCIRIKRLLDEKGISYHWLDIVAEPELADRVVEFNIQAGFGPKRRIPVVLVDDRILSEPSNEEMLSAISHG